MILFRDFTTTLARHQGKLHFLCVKLSAFSITLNYIQPDLATLA